MNYLWNIKHKYNNDILSLFQQEHNFNDQEMNNFLSKKLVLVNPTLIPNMKIASDKIHEAIHNNQHITIVGDYDCDGITSTSIMMMGLSILGANIDWILPHRVFDGYGLKKHLIDKCIARGTNLIITVDNGIAAHDAVKYANDNDIDVIVTDHHPLLQDDVPCNITIDPHLSKNLKFTGICGCMVAYKLLRTLIPELYKMPIHKEIVALTTIATIADSMPLLDENRSFVYHGLKLINKTNNYGLNALLSLLKLDDKQTITSTDVGFGIAPCINAAGRIESSDICVNLFLSDDKIQSYDLALKLVHYNEQRKTIQKEVINSINVDNEDNIILVKLDDIPIGILGIIAGRIMSKYQRPCFVFHEKEKEYIGSGRGIEGYDISSCIHENFDIVSGGGHAGACGVSVPKDNYDEFEKRCKINFSNWRKTACIKEITPTLDIISDIDFMFIDDDLMSNINKLEPYGNGNDELLLCSKNVFVKNARILGKAKNAIKFELMMGNVIKEGIGFNDICDKYNSLGNPTNIDIAYSLHYNEWNGNKTIQLTISDIVNH